MSACLLIGGVELYSTGVKGGRRYSTRVAFLGVRLLKVRSIGALL